jgi:hypothetical protein
MELNAKRLVLRKSFVLMVVASGLICGIFPVPAVSDSLFSQPYTGYPMAWGSDTNQGFLIADDFTLISDSWLTDFHWWGAYAETPPGTSVPNDDWSLRIYPDLATLQNFGIYDSVVFTNLNPYYTGANTYFGNAVFGYSADFVTPLFLSAGTYYAMLFGHGVDPQFAGWAIADDTTVSSSWGYNPDFDLWSQTDTNQAFEITGTPIPEPTSLLLLGTGLGVLGLEAYRRRRK